MQDREVRKGTNWQQLLLWSALGALLALGSCCALLLLCAGLVSASVIPAHSMMQLCALLLALCALFGGRLAVKRSGAAPILAGAVSGVMLCLLLLGISFLFYQTPAVQGSGLWLLFATLLGGVLASFARPPKRNKARKKR